jgi:hypothetical protein
MATTGRGRTEEQPTNQVHNIPGALSASDWRRLTDATRDTIAHRAYELYQRRGCQPDTSWTTGFRQNTRCSCVELQNDL